MNYYLRAFGYAIVIWFFATVLDTLRALFTLSTDGTVRGWFGVALHVSSNGEELVTNLSLTPYLGLSFLIVLAVCVVIAIALRLMNQHAPEGE